MFCATLGVAGLAGTIPLLSGCGGGVDKSGPAVTPQNMDAAKKKQYEDFMKSRGGGGGKSNGPPPPHS